MTSLYSFLDAALQTLVGVCFPSVALLFFLGLACLYAPMLRVREALTMWTGPRVATVGMVTTFNAGHAVEFGGDVVVRGVQVAFSRAVGLALAGVLAVQMLWLARAVTRRAALHALRIATALAVVWWLFVARGYRSLDNVFNDAFVASLAVLLGVAFRSPTRHGPAHQHAARCFPDALPDAKNPAVTRGWLALRPVSGILRQMIGD